MISQHLLLRCKQGYNDKSMSASLKTAAVSDSFLEYSKDFRSDLEQEIITAVLPDNVTVSKNSNRGILRITYLDDVIIANRIFRVLDKCDYRGESTFTHTYMFDDEDRETILDNTYSLSVLSNFDSYLDIDRRCGGLQNCNPINIKTEFHYHQASFGDVFSECGFTAETFSKLIGEICQVISLDGYVSVILPKVNEETWEEEGGSELGEKFILSLLKILPDCLSRFFSGISYWNESNSFYGIEDIKIRVSSGKNKENLYNLRGMTVFDIPTGADNSHLESSVFGEYLWNIRNEPEKIREFHDYIKDIFGENVDTVIKPSRLMDTITDMYLNKDGFSDRKKTDHITSELLELFGQDIISFPKINEFCGEGIVNLYQTVGNVLDKLAGTIVSNNIISDMTSKYLFECILKGTDDDNIVKSVKDIIIQGKCQEINDYFREVIEKIGEEGTGDISKSMFKLLTSYYTDDQVDDKIGKNIFDILQKESDSYYSKQNYSQYLQIMFFIMSSQRTISFIDDPEDPQSIEKWYNNNLSCIINCSYKNIACEDRQMIVNMLTKHFEIIRKKEFSQYLCVCFCNVVFFPREGLGAGGMWGMDGIFEMFIQLSPYINGDTKCLENWKNQYSEILEQNFELYQDSDKYLDSLDDQGKILTGLRNNEKVRKKVSKNSSWKAISNIISFTGQKEKKYEYIHEGLSDIFNYDISNYEEIVSDMSADDIFFGYCLYAFGQRGENEDKILEKYSTTKEDCLDHFIITAQNDGRTDILKEKYYTLWRQIYVKSNVSINELIDELYNQEKKLEVLGKEHQQNIMVYFRDLFQEKGAFEIDTIKNVFSGDDADPTSLSFKTVCFINHCIDYYGWSSKSSKNKKNEKIISDDICDYLKTRQMLDNIILDQNFYISSKRDTVLKYLFAEKGKSKIQEFQGYIKASIDEKNKDENVTSKVPAEENIALLGLLSTMNLKQKEMKSSLAWTYLSLLNAGSATANAKTMTWRGYGYLMFGLKWLCIMGHPGVVIINDISRYKESFVSLFAKNIDSQRKKFILECRETYERYVKNEIDSELRKKLATSAEKSKDEEFMAMFPMEKEPIISKAKFFLQSIFGQKNPGYVPPEKPSKSSNPKYSSKRKK